MDELQMLVIALGYVVAFIAGRWTAMRSALLTNLADAVSDGIDKIEDVTGIDIPDDLEDKIEDVRERMGLDAGVIDKYRRAFALIDLDSGGAIPRRSEPRASSRTEA